jgi:predicted HTH transcriptional regulator
MAKKRISFKEEFARFLDDPSRDRLRDLLKEHHGELPELEFKAEWPDTPRLVKLILGIANTGGGCLIVGVSETVDKKMECTGLKAFCDKTDLDKSLRNFLPPPLMDGLAILDFAYEDSDYKRLAGKSFQVLIVPDDPQNVPFMPSAETTGLRKTSIFVRRMASTEEATYEEIQTIINRRITTGRSNQPMIDLQSHLEHLRVLYRQMERHRQQNPSWVFGIRLGFGYESFEEFTLRMIEVKKWRIRSLVEL